MMMMMMLSLLGMMVCSWCNKIIFWYTFAWRLAVIVPVRWYVPLKNINNNDGQLFSRILFLFSSAFDGWKWKLFSLAQTNDFGHAVVLLQTFFFYSVWSIACEPEWCGPYSTFLSSVYLCATLLDANEMDFYGKSFLWPYTLCSTS